ncbi:MAG: hypothetical protein KA715_12550 [Xanthomonadaceae bacterium]|nr:hypothetical protein [Xanthomonadaceae bacterium]
MRSFEIGITHVGGFVLYLLKLAMRPWRKSAVVQTLSAISFSFMIFLMSLFFWMDRELKPLVTKLRSDQVLTVYLNSDTNASDEKRIVDSIRTSVGAHPDIRMISSDGFLEEMKKNYPDLIDEVYQLGPEMKVTVPKYVSVAGTLNSNVIPEIKKLTGVDSIDISYNKLRQAAGPFQTLRLFSKFMFVGLLIAGICGVVLLGRSISSQHKETLSLMELMGASEFEKKTPALLSGISVGLLSGLLSFILWVSFAAKITGALRVFSPALANLSDPKMLIGFALMGVSILVGMGVGLIGSDA